MSPAPTRTKGRPAPPPPPPPPPPSSPRILLFPRSSRTRRRQPKPTTLHHRQPPVHSNRKHPSHREKLEALFDRENTDSPTPHGPLSDLLNSNSETASGVDARDRVDESEEGEHCAPCNGGGLAAEEKWRFQAEILRAECNFLRLEREFAVKKMEKNRVMMETALKSALQTLVSGRRKISQGENANAVLTEEIDDLAEKLEDLQETSRIKDYELPKCRNLDTEACLLQCRLEKLEQISWRESSDQYMDQESSSITTTNCETVNKSATDEPFLHDNKCSGQCKAVIRRVVEQVRAETEQWSQMQEMLRQVRGEMEELQASRDYWESQARNSGYVIESLRHSVQEWKEKALGYENKVQELKLELSVLKAEVKKTKGEQFVKQLEKEKLALSRRVNIKQRIGEEGWEFGNALEELRIEDNKERLPNKDPAPLSLGRQLAKEMKKKMLLHRLKDKENSRHTFKKTTILQEPSNGGKTDPCSNSIGVIVAMDRSPLRDIGNSTISLV